MIVHINLNCNNVASTFHPFNENFLDNEFSKSNGDEFPCNYLQMKPHDIFDWGVEKGVILYDNLLDKALEEADRLHLNRMKRQELSKNQIPQNEWPEELKAEVRLDVEDDHFITFGDKASPNLLGEKLRNALKNRENKNSV